MGLWYPLDMLGSQDAGSAAVLATLGKRRLLPVIVLDDVDSARPLARALLAGGLRCAEVTFRTETAEAALRVMAEEPDLVVGAGTILRPEQVDRAVSAGARFIVSPGLSVKVVQRCRELDVPIVPGVATATEIQSALDYGLEVLKLFPAEPLGGASLLRALAAPFPQVRFVPTGGIGAQQLPAYLSQHSVLAVGGSWMVAPALIRQRAWDEIVRLTTEAVNLTDQGASQP